MKEGITLRGWVAIQTVVIPILVSGASLFLGIYELVTLLVLVTLFAVGIMALASAVQWATARIAAEAAIIAVWFSPVQVRLPFRMTWEMRASIYFSWFFIVTVASLLTLGLMIHFFEVKCLPLGWKTPIQRGVRAHSFVLD